MHPCQSHSLIGQSLTFNGCMFCMNEPKNGLKNLHERVLNVETWIKHEHAFTRGCETVTSDASLRLSQQSGSNIKVEK